MKYQNYREWIKDEFKARVANNPRYSLRAFARDVKLSPASISLVFSGRKGLSKNSAERIAKQLGFNEVDQRQFLSLVESSRAKPSGSRGRSFSRQIKLIAASTESYTEVLNKIESFSEKLTEEYSTSPRENKQNPEYELTLQLFIKVP